MKNQPLVSIVVPYFNRKPFVKIMVESIIEQSYLNWELLMIDDGSTDGTTALIDDFARRDSRIFSYVRDEFSSIKGACVCRNIGLQKAQGKYIVFFDSDDWITPSCISDRVAFMEANSHIDFCISPFYKYVDKNVYNGYTASGVDVGQDDLSNLVIRNLPFTVVNNMYKRLSLISNNILWDEKLVSLQDADFNISCLNKNLAYLYCNQDRFDYYVRMIGNTSSISKTVFNESQFRSHLWFLKKNISRNRALGRNIELMAESVYILVNSLGYVEEYSKQLKNLVQKGGLRIILSCKDVICKILHCKCRIPLKIVFRLIFPLLLIKYKISAKKRLKKCRVIHQNCYEQIKQIEKMIIS